jgi:hypothetical protein
VALAVMEVELWVLPVGTGAKVGAKPTTAADASAAADDEVGRWGCDGTPSGTSKEHCWMELPQPSASLLPCGRGTHHPR